MLAWLSRDGRLDFALAALAYDPASASFPWRDHPAFARLGHDGLRLVPQAVWAVVSVLALAAGRFGSLRPWRGSLAYASLAILATAAVVVALKRVSAHSCPWDVAPFGATGEWFPLFAELPARPGPGRCWPGGHASGGFALLALYFALRDRARRQAWLALVLALLLGLAMSAVQVMRGAHFATHNAWTLWIAWACCASLYAAWRVRAGRDRWPGAGQTGSAPAAASVPRHDSRQGPNTGTAPKSQVPTQRERRRWQPGGTVP